MTTEINRRQFLGGAIAAAGVGATHHALKSTGVGAMLLPKPDKTYSTTGDRILVLVTLYGGLDGLEVLIPYTDPAYYSARGAIAIPQASVLQLGDNMAFNPALANMKGLWDSGNLAIMRGVGYPNPNYSHFSSMDIWQSGSPSGEVGTGWIGRWLDRTGTDPQRALYLGSNLPLAFVGQRQQAAAINANPNPAAQLPPGDVTYRLFYEELERHRAGQTVLETDVARSGTGLVGVGKTVSGLLGQVPAPSKYITAAAGGLGVQLSMVYQMITAGARTRVYGVSIGGFDSHAGEIASYTPLLKQVDAAIGGFFSALQGTPNASQVVMLVYSEFGRRVNANASLGTDHGSGNVAFLVGQQVRGGFYGDQPSLTQLDSNGSLDVVTDFRSIYATILDQVLDIDPSAVLKGSTQAPINYLA